MKIGDKVSFLSEIGGGRVAGFQGKDIVLVMSLIMKEIILNNFLIK